MNLIISRLLPSEDVPQKSSARFALLLPLCHNGVIAFTDRHVGGRGGQTKKQRSPCGASHHLFYQRAERLAVNSYNRVLRPVEMLNNEEEDPKGRGRETDRAHPGRVSYPQNSEMAVS